MAIFNHQHKSLDEFALQGGGHREKEAPGLPALRAGRCAGEKRRGQECYFPSSKIMEMQQKV